VVSEAGNELAAGGGRLDASVSHPADNATHHRAFQPMSKADR